MHILILITGIIAATLFILSGISFFFQWGNFKHFAMGFLTVAITMFVLMIIRNAKEEWAIGGNKKGQ